MESIAGKILSLEEIKKTYARNIAEKIVSAKKGSDFHILGTFLMALDISKNPKWKNHVDIETLHNKINHAVTVNLKESLEDIKKTISRDLDIPLYTEEYNLEFKGELLDIIIPYLFVSFSGISKLFRYYKISKVKNSIFMIRHFGIFAKFSVLFCFLGAIFEIPEAYKRFKYKDYPGGICKILIFISTLVTGIIGVYMLLGELTYLMYSVLIGLLIITIITWIIYILFRKSKEEIFLKELGLWK